MAFNYHNEPTIECLIDDLVATINFQKKFVNLVVIQHWSFINFGKFVNLVGK